MDQCSTMPQWPCTPAMMDTIYWEGMRVPASIVVSGATLTWNADVRYIIIHVPFLASALFQDAILQRSSVVHMNMYIHRSTVH